MKKWMSTILALIFAGGAFLLSACSFETYEPAKDSKYGSLTFNAARYLNTSEITIAKVNVYGSDMETLTKEIKEVSDGKASATIEKIPVGKNRVIEVIGYKDSSSSVPVKYLYHVMDIKSGNNTCTIKDSSDSAKGKAYLALLNKGVDISSVDLGDFSGVSSAYLFDADSFATAYKSDSSVKASSYIQTVGSVNFTKISNATGYTIWIDDPLSSKVSLSGSETSASATGVAPGTWNVYVNDGSSTKKVGSVTVTSGSSATYSGVIGNALAGKLFIFVKASSAPTIWAWETESGTELSANLDGNWDSQKTMDAATSDYMNDPEGWYMRDFSSAGALKGVGTISFKLNKSDPELSSGKTATFWYDGSSFYDADPTTTPVLDSDATLSDIKVNDSSVGVVTEYSVPYKTSSVTITATATSSKATVTVSPSAETTLTVGTAKDFTIKVTAQDGTEKSYTISVTRNAEIANDVTLSTIKVNGSSIGTLSGTSFTKSLTGSEDSMSVTVTAEANSSAAKVVVSDAQTVSDGGSKTFTISVTNGTGSATYTVTVSYTKVAGSQYYWTNKNGAVGTNKTISSWSDWTEAERIAQNAAYDDPRTWKGHHEVPYDVYALYAAYDDTNLYLMVELTNIADRASFMTHDYAGSDNAWWNNRDIPLGMLFNTGKGVNSTKPTVGTTGPIWGAIDFSDSQGFDALFYHSSKYGEFDGTFVGVGTPGFFKTTSNGVFSYDDEYCLSFNTGTTTGTSGISVKYQRQCAVSKTIYYESTPTDNRTTSSQDGNDLLASTTYTAVSTGDLDMSYWYTIPLSTLGIDKAYLQSSGIGVRQLTTNGGSLMDCSPWDVSMVDIASGECSDDASTSAEKEDCDDITSAQARIGHM